MRAGRRLGRLSGFAAAVLIVLLSVIPIGLEVLRSRRRTGAAGQAPGTDANGGPGSTQPATDPVD